jgi:S13-like H2TH domain
MPERRLQALGHANEVRYARAQLKRDLRAGRVGLPEVLSEPPACAQTAIVRDLLLASPGIGPVKADRALTRCGIAHSKAVIALSSRQRVSLVEFLRR